MANDIALITNISADALTILKGGVVGAIAVGTKYAITGIQGYVNYQKQKQQLDFLNQRTGNSTINGGRYR